MTFHPLIILPTDVRSTWFFGGFFSALVENDLGFVDVCGGVCVGTSTSVRFDTSGILLFFSPLVEDDLGFVDVCGVVCVVPTSGHESRILVCVISDTD